MIKASLVTHGGFLLGLISMGVGIHADKAIGFVLSAVASVTVSIGVRMAYRAGLTRWEES